MNRSLACITRILPWPIRAGGRVPVEGVVLSRGTLFLALRERITAKFPPLKGIVGREERGVIRLIAPRSQTAYKIRALSRQRAAGVPG